MMATKIHSEISRDSKDFDKSNDEVDPRVQIELERLNTATDDINKLEVDLDESRAAFRQLLCESTVRIDALAKKLGTCVERARPYYEARMRAKEALQETQQAAVRFERANSAHAAAKEMVYLAEEGLSTEGRTFDHAWQEMLNHATMRVNESERERTLSEMEHRRTSQTYHRAEMRVQQLQKELKRAIAKSSLNARRSMLQINSLAYQHQLQLLPYFEMKAHFNQLLEDQKKRVKSLEQQVGHAKMSYAEALRNLEQISDEIHRTRKYDGGGDDPLGARGAGVGAESPLPLTASSPEASSDNPGEPVSRKITPPGLSSCSLPDTDLWSDSTGTGPPDSDSGEEFLRLPEKLGPTGSPVLAKGDREVAASQASEFLGLANLSSNRGQLDDSPSSRPMAELAIRSQNTLQSSSLSPRHVVSAGTDSIKTGARIMETSFVDKHQGVSLSATNPFLSPSALETQGEAEESGTAPLLFPHEDSSDQIWTEISLVDSPDDSSAASHTFAKMGPIARNIDRDYIQYSPLTDQAIEQTLPSPSEATSFLRNTFLPTSILPSSPKINKPDMDKTSKSLASPAKKLITQAWNEIGFNSENKSPEEHPLLSSPGHKGLFRAMSLVDRSDRSGGSPVASGRPKLDASLSGWISRTEPAANGQGATNAKDRRQSLDTMLWSGPTTERVKELLSHGMMMLNISSLTERRASEPRSNASDQPEGTTGTSDIFKEGRPGSGSRKVPSPLEKSLNYLNAEEDSTSDSESLASVEMLTDDQISSLMLDQEIQDACEEVLGTPISEISPLIQDLKQREQHLQLQQQTAEAIQE
ncbi:uro-adherence factor A isoform X2 [Anabrus simplex]|uniref:uro-adherence factor A isoform X2 n=1 Tax=Anabrus simplex TaxID=316456 RepID=UPI0035A371F0